MVVSLYTKGMSCADIGVSLEEAYGQQIGKDVISRIVDDMNQWLYRPLDSLYPVILIDAIVVKISHVSRPYWAEEKPEKPRDGNKS